MPAIAITDHGNMHGIPEFTRTAEKYGVRAILGCEFYLSADMSDKTDKRRYHQVLLAKNEVGYRNLIKLSSAAFVDGFYYKPRIDRKILAERAEGDDRGPGQCEGREDAKHAARHKDFRAGKEEARDQQYQEYFHGHH